MSFLESAFKFKLKMNKKKFSILKPCIRLATMLVLECFIISCIAPNYCSKSYNVLFSSKICNLNSTLNRTSDCLAPPLKTNKLARDEVRDFVLAATKNAEDLYTSMRRNVNPDREFQVYLTKYVKESLKFPEFQPIAQEVRNKLLELDDRDRLVDAANRALATIPEGIRDITADISLEDVVSVFGNALTITIAFELAVEREGPDYFILHKDEIVEGLFNVIVLAKAWREVHEAEKIKKALKEYLTIDCYDINKEYKIATWLKKHQKLR